MNTISVRVSQRRSVLSILNANVENTGIYECRGVNNEDVTASDLVTVNICKLHYFEYNTNTVEPPKSDTDGPTYPKKKSMEVYTSGTL